ncbi:alpha-amylase family protein [Amycolatopsis sp.]|uniref:alpha-amylase family protein n=1 Tax=Amycolatopsis sp. TaxID=37632 RepID=UPI002DFD5FA9|nr:alpha-amylase family protein [Amycolatopsis sp.]
MAYWTEHAIFWHVYPLGFVGAPASANGAEPIPRLKALEPWLDHLLELGANGLLLGPVLASETHGYDTVDHYRIDPRLGTSDDLTALVAQAHQRGIRVVLDGVFNHVGRGFAKLTDVEQRGDASPWHGWFARGEDGTLATFEGHHRLVELNHDEPAVADYVADVLNHWLDQGVDGWRLDAAYAVPADFWRQVSDRVHQSHPEAWLLGETIHGDYPAMITAGGLDAVTQYELWKAIWSSLNDRNFHELAHALARHQELLDTFVPQTFLGNHDVTRIASRLTDSRHLAHAVVVLCTVAGVPSIYAGDEHGFTGVKEDREGGDDEIRPKFPATPADLSPLGIGVYRLHQELISLRRRHPWLVRAHTTVLELDNERLLYRSTKDGHVLFVALNLAERDAWFTVPAGTSTVEAGHAELQGDRAPVAEHGWVVLSGPEDSR